MARTITSPGVEIFEKDLSLRTNISSGTNVLVSGFATQGPTVEPLLVTSVSELESIYGLPTTPAERYFYHTCKEVLNSPATLTTVRLPYGTGAGDTFSQLYSALLFPMASGAESAPLSAQHSWILGEPVHINLTEGQYNAILQNDFDWNATAVGTTKSGAVVTSVGTASVNLTAATISLSGGFLVLNDLQTTINDYAEGYYIGFADNSNVYAANDDFDAVTALKTLSATSTFALVDESRLDFALSATEADSAAGIDSVSEDLEKVGFIGFENNDYMDHLSLGVYKVRRSNAKENVLALSQLEKYVGSFDYARKEISPTGGVLSNAFIEDKINESSPTIKVFINPTVSKIHDWTVNSTVPTSNVRVSSAAKKMYPVGVYSPTSAEATNKLIGSVPSKLEKSFRLVEIPENTTVDVVCDGGLSTIYALTTAQTTLSSGDGTFDDTINIDSSSIAVGNASAVVESWTAVSNTLITFAQDTRKDCVAILDPLRNIFVNGKDRKVVDVPGNTFTTSIYTPFKNLVSAVDSNYAAIYGNWAKVRDNATDKLVWVPFSGFAAAVFAKSDRIAYPWSAPAGLNRGLFQAIDIAFNPNQKQRDRFYDLGVNPVVFFSGDGYTIFGQKTLQSKPSAFDRINVRRLFLSLERATQRALKYFVFEPNTEFTRTRLKNTITPIFELAKNTEGIFSYEIVCDSRNNLSNVIDNNELIVDVYIKPVRTSEYILVNFVATRTGQNFQELI